MSDKENNAVVVPHYDDLPLRGGARCSWGVWGADDKLGTLNNLTEARAQAAAATVKRGASFSLDWSMSYPNPPIFERGATEHIVTGFGDGNSQDDILNNWNTQATSQWDGFRHIRRRGHGVYNGLPDGEHGVHFWAERGIVGRGILADVARYRESIGRPIAHGTPEPITVEELEATFLWEGVTPQPGDILLVRTGWIGWYLGQTPERKTELGTFVGLVTPGLDPSEAMARWLWDNHFASAAADNPSLEIWPIGSHTDPVLLAEINADLTRDYEMLLHSRLLPMLGFPIGELFALDTLAADCAEDGRYTFLLTSAVIPLQNGVGSPPNALAIK
ncbi:MAG TPA: cyclase family protein, partial [Galbitalea sp.]|jgi:hypothetical protein|nr:cyclase family protein [Galbitalea sp.]